MAHIIGLSGKKSAGKTTIAEHIRYLTGAPIYSFSEPIKKILIDLYNIPAELLYGSENAKNQLTDIKGKDGNYLTIRNLMTQVGQYLRSIDPHCFINSLDTRLKKCDSKILIVSDIRFPNELSYIKNKYGIILRLERNVLPPDPDISEIALDSYNAFDYNINGGLSLDKVKDRIAQILKKEGII